MALGTAASQTTLKSVEDPLIFNKIHSEYDRIVSRLSDIRTRLNSLADHLIGSEEEVAGKNGAQCPSPSAVAPRFEYTAPVKLSFSAS